MTLYRTLLFVIVLHLIIVWECNDIKVDQFIYVPVFVIEMGFYCSTCWSEKSDGQSQLLGFVLID